MVFRLTANAFYNAKCRADQCPAPTDHFFDTQTPHQTVRGVTYRMRSCQKATAAAAATFRESTPWDMGIFTV